jgi:hypothetical protein
MQGNRTGRQEYGAPIMSTERHPAAAAYAPRNGLFHDVSHAIRRRIHLFVRRFIAPISRHPAMTVMTGCGLLFTGVMEIMEDVYTDFDSMVGAREGIILLGIVTFFKGLADLVEASEWLSKGVDEREQVEKN